MRAADLVRQIWGQTPPATVATSATNRRASGGVSQLSQLSQGAGKGNFRPPVATVATVAAPEATQNGLADLLAQHGGYSGVDWGQIALISASTSALWVVQRPDGLLTVLATVEPIPKPRSYAAAWPARFTSPEPTDDTEPAAPAARAAIARARESPF